MKIKQMVVIAAMLISTTAFAQFTQNRTRRNTSSIENGWNSIYASYNMLKYSQEMLDYNKAYNGFSIGYDRAIGLTSKLPLYVEVGAAIQYAGQSIKEEGETSKANLLSAKIPVSVLYRWNISNSNWSIAPKVGFDGRFNVIGKGKETYEDWYTGKFVTDKYNMFKEGEGNGLHASGDKCSRFQAGWHVGANVEYKSSFIGITYGTDMNTFCKDRENVHFRTLTISLGYKF